jgi:hypothetical protein
VVYLLFYTACLAHGLLQNDDESQQCLTEVAGMCTGDALHCLFALIMQHCDDLQHSLNLLGILMPSDTDVYNYGLFLLNKKLSNVGTLLSIFPNMPHILNDWAIIDKNPFISEQLSYNRINKLRLAEYQIPQLNAEQKAAYDSILDSVYV